MLEIPRRIGKDNRAARTFGTLYVDTVAVFKSKSNHVVFFLNAGKVVESYVAQINFICRRNIEESVRTLILAAVENIIARAADQSVVFKTAPKFCAFGGRVNVLTGRLSARHGNFFGSGNRLNFGLSFGYRLGCNLGNARRRSRHCRVAIARRRAYA